MKRVLLFIAALVLLTTVSEAKNEINPGKKTPMVKTEYTQPIVFVENGIKFSVQTNGEFRFSKLNYTKIYSHRNTRLERNRAAHVERDFYGRIIKVDNVPIFYDRYGNVTQIGTIDLKYKKNKLVKIGGLHIVYHPHGAVKFIGKVTNETHTVGKRTIVLS